MKRFVVLFDGYPHAHFATSEERASYLLTIYGDEAVITKAEMTLDEIKAAEAERDALIHESFNWEQNHDFE